MLSLILIILGSLVLAVMAVAAHSLAYFPGDVTVSHAVQAYQSEGLDAALRDVSWTGFPPQSNVVFGLVVILVLVAWSRWAAVAEALAAIGSGGLYLLLQLVVGQPRPTADLVRVDAPVQLSAFPSGHLTTFTAVFGFVAFLAWRRLSPGAARWLPILLVVALLALMSFARIYSGQHWPSDVLGGVLLGGLWLSVVIHLYLWREGRQRRTAISGSGRTPGHDREANPARARSA